MSEELAPEAPEIEVTPEVTPEAPAEVIDPNPVDEAIAEPEKEAQEEKRKQSRFERRMEKLRQSAAEQKARGDLLERQLEELKPKAPSGMPKLEDFDDIEEYATAKGNFSAQQALREHQNANEQKTRQQSQQKLVSDWTEKTANADEKYPDFDEVVGELKPVNALSVAVMESENADDVAYFLATNKDELQRIMSLSPVSQIREIGRLEAKLLAVPPKAKQPSKAPAPISPLTGKAGSISDVASDSDDMDTWMRKERAREKKARA